MKRLAKKSDSAEVDLSDAEFIGPVTTILPAHGWVRLDLRQVWEYRELLYFLTWRDITVRYKQTILGAAWSILQPFLTMIVFSIFFGNMAGLASDGSPYPIFSYTALVPWFFFSTSLTQSSNSLVGNSQLIKKVFFPRLAIPISNVLSPLVDMALAFVVLLLMMPFYGIWPTINFIWLPFFTLLAFITALGVGLWFSALNVEYRDVRYIVPFLSQFWMFASPVVYSSSSIKNPWLQMIYGINPMAGVIDGFRWAILGKTSAPGPIIWVSLVVALVILVSGAFYFRRMEHNFADVV
jgi:lipopolysaccharide transport system permease protein